MRALWRYGNTSRPCIGSGHALGDPSGDGRADAVACHAVAVGIGDLAAVGGPPRVVVGPALEPFALPRREAAHGAWHICWHIRSAVSQVGDAEHGGSTA